MPVRHTHTDIPALLEAERVARNEAKKKLREALAIREQIEAVASREDRYHNRFSHYRDNRLPFARFVNDLRRSKRSLMASLGTLDGIRELPYIPAQALIEERKAELERREERRKRRASA